MGNDQESNARQGDPAELGAQEVFTEYRELLFAVAYNMLGTVSDSEDVLQETWLSWASARHDTIADPRSYLVRITVNQALRRLRQVRGGREVYVGPWLPEPLVTGTSLARVEDTADAVGRTESVSLALLVVLETLSPLERAVFVLREAFGYEHTEIAEVLGRSPAAVRQLAHRAREHVQARRPRYEPDPRVRRAVTDRFLAAALGGDLAELMEVLAPDVTMWTDSGGHLRAAHRPIQGRDKVARLIAAQHQAYGTDLRIHPVEVNGHPASLVFGSKVFGVLVVEVAPGSDRVSEIYGVVNPNKLSRAKGALDALR
ncbi:RNA polymerase sigma24 factor [Actinomadura sp. NBRC 104412]|uniref:RNA polymerase sigma factor SigJ n=1 Tax=Actinomadura sp. NBRC 104412 TaxID=3032203 RepID=UPI0024A192AA|nr:RNA polymerase sigma factor SigJ [Actinomadura sp. NBRC 104412]GLZ09179.1 RNA polymerase sigma24 factor [Actinomadura sp. NBRC 104412]